MIQLCASNVRGHLLAARKRLLALTRDLDSSRLIGTRNDCVDPPLWALGHVGWFQERWCLRPQPDQSLADSMYAGADRLYDPQRVPRTARWELPLPALRETHRYLNQTIERVIELLETRPEDPELLNAVERAAAHEDQHAEALHASWQTLGYEAPLLGCAYPTGPVTEAVRTNDVELPGGSFMAGAYPETGFVFDNERWAHEVQIVPFAIARVPVTEGQYLEFVESGGYRERRWWSDEGWTWRNASGLVAPRYWRQVSRRWMVRRFDRILPLRADHPIVHVCWHEAQAYCRYAGRRLPTEFEWEYAAAYPNVGREKTRYPWGDAAVSPGVANLEGQETVSVHAAAGGDSASGMRQCIGNVWEWTGSTFTAYPGFVRDAFKEYSEPSFGTHKVLRGGSFATSVRLVRSTLRSFHLPHRADPFAGFRTCRLEPP